MRGFHVVDLTAQCELRLQAHYEYELLERIEGAPELLGTLAGEIWRAPEAFELLLTPFGGEGLVLRWRASADTSGIATIHNEHNSLSVSLLASGLDQESDRLTLEAFQRYVVQELHDTGFEPSFDLVQLEQRPLLATVGLFVPQSGPQKRVFALADRCFAAAYFRRLGLA